MIALAAFLVVLPFATAFGIVIAISLLMYTAAYAIYDRLIARCSAANQNVGAFDRLA